MSKAKLSREQIEIISKTAAEQTLAFHEKANEEVRQKEKDKRLHNTKLLLKHYQELKLYTSKTKEKKADDKLAQEDKKITATITFAEDEDIISSIKATTKRTVAMIRYIDNALETLEFMYKQEKNERDFNILKKRYIEGCSIQTLAELYALNDRSIYKALDGVVDRLSVLLFGIYGIDKQGKNWATQGHY